MYEKLYYCQLGTERLTNVDLGHFLMGHENNLPANSGPYWVNNQTKIKLNWAGYMDLLKVANPIMDMVYRKKTE